MDTKVDSKVDSKPEVVVVCDDLINAYKDADRPGQLAVLAILSKELKLQIVVPYTGPDQYLGHSSSHPNKDEMEQFICSVCGRYNIIPQTSDGKRLINDLKYCDLHHCQNEDCGQGFCQECEEFNLFPMNATSTSADCSIDDEDDEDEEIINLCLNCRRLPIVTAFDEIFTIDQNNTTKPARK